MDPKLLRYYERELQYIREMGAEFAQEFPNVAGHLRLDGTQPADPYVERLLEGFAFLAARVNLRIDAEYPKFTQNLLQSVYPHYLTPCPAMAVVRFEPTANASLEAGFNVPRGTSLRSNLLEGEQTACIFRTAQSVDLWPVAVTEAEYFTNMGRLDGLGIASNRPLRAGLRLRLVNQGGGPLRDLLLDQLRIYLAGPQTRAVRLYEQLFGNTCAVVLQPPEGAKSWAVTRPASCIKPVGFAADEALLPADPRSFSGYRLLREYFAFGERFLFWDLADLGAGLEHCEQSAMDVLILFDRCDNELVKWVEPEDFAVNCAPIINLFPKRADRIHLGPKPYHHIVPDRTRPTDFEVFEVTKVVGYGASGERQQQFLPFYGATDTTDYPGHAAYYSLTRERRVLPAGARRRGPRSQYIGSECYLALVDNREAPYPGDLKQLEVHTLCTNRDLPLRLRCGREPSDFDLEVSAPVASVRCVRGPTAPRPSLSHAEGETAWRLINHLSLNYATLFDSDAHGGAAALRQLLNLYCDLNDATLRKQIEAVRSVRARPVTRRLPTAGPMAFGRGLEIALTMDESGFAGSGIFLLGAVLEQFFARYVSINSFTETVLNSLDRGEVMRWPARFGQRPLA